MAKWTKRNRGTSGRLGWDIVNSESFEIVCVAIDEDRADLILSALNREDALQKAWDKYGDHLQDCAVRWAIPQSCTCGFNDACESLAAAREETK